jgi:hypothetical protein
VPAPSPAGSTLARRAVDAAPNGAGDTARTYSLSVPRCFARWSPLCELAEIPMEQLGLAYDVAAEHIAWSQRQGITPLVTLRLLGKRYVSERPDWNEALDALISEQLTRQRHIG